MEVQVKATLGTTLYQTKVIAGNNELISDEPQNIGGGNKGFNPFELLASSLATCTAATLRMYIDRKQWLVDEIVVDVELIEDKENKTTNFKRAISFVGGNIDEEQKKRLYLIAEKCPVHRVITGNVIVNTTI